MKINTSDYIVENKIVTVSEEGIIYDLPRNKAQEAWDKLAEYYNAKIGEENAELIKIDEFFKSLAFAKVENEAMLETLRLPKKSVLKSYESVESDEPDVNIKSHIRSEIVDILKRRLDELKENVEREQKVYDKIKNINKEIIIVGRKLKILTSPFTFMDFDEFQQKIDSNPVTGLTCILKFNDLVIKGFYKSSQDNHTIDYSQYNGTYTKDNVQIKLSNEFSEEENEVCFLIVEEIIKNYEIDEILDSVHLKLSRFYSNKIVEKSKMKKFVEIGSVKLADKMTPIFYIVFDEGVLKVKRTKNDFEIYLNGNKMTDFTKAQAL